MTTIRLVKLGNPKDGKLVNVTSRTDEFVITEKMWLDIVSDVQFIDDAETRTMWRERRNKFRESKDWNRVELIRYRGVYYGSGLSMFRTLIGPNDSPQLYLSQYYTKNGIRVHNIGDFLLPGASILVLPEGIIVGYFSGLNVGAIQANLRLQRRAEEELIAADIEEQMEAELEDVPEEIVNERKAIVKRLNELIISNREEVIRLFPELRNVNVPRGVRRDATIAGLQAIIRMDKETLAMQVVEQHPDLNYMMTGVRFATDYYYPIVSNFTMPDAATQNYPMVAVFRVMHSTWDTINTKVASELTKLKLTPAEKPNGELSYPPTDVIVKGPSNAMLPFFGMPLYITNLPRTTKHVVDSYTFVRIITAALKYTQSFLFKKSPIVALRDYAQDIQLMRVRLSFIDDQNQIHFLDFPAPQFRIRPGRTEGMIAAFIEQLMDTLDEEEYYNQYRNSVLATDSFAIVVVMVKAPAITDITTYARRKITRERQERITKRPKTMGILNPSITKRIKLIQTAERNVIPKPALEGQKIGRKRMINMISKNDEEVEKIMQQRRKRPVEDDDDDDDDDDDNNNNNNNNDDDDDDDDDDDNNNNNNNNDDDDDDEIINLVPPVYEDLRPPKEKVVPTAAQAARDAKRLELIRNRTLGAPESHSYMLFDTLQDTGTNKCMTEALQKCNYHGYILAEQTIVSLLRCIEDNKLPISIIYNIPVLKESRFDNNTTSLLLPKAKHPKNFYRVMDKDIDITYLYDYGDDAEYVLVYDVQRSHVEVAVLPLQLLPNVFASEIIISKVYDDDYVIIRNIIEKVKPAKLKRSITNYVFFRIESVPDIVAGSLCVPFMMTTFIISEGNLRSFAYKNGNKKEANDKMEQYFNTVVGLDCIAKSIEALYAVVNNSDVEEEFIMMGFGNSEIDNFHILEYLQQDAYIKHASYVGYHGNFIGALLFFKSKVSMFDLNRHIPGSIYDLTDAFGAHGYACNPRPFSEHLIQHVYEKSRIDNNFIAQLDTYIGISTLQRCQWSEVAIIAYVYHVYITAWNSISSKTIYVGKPKDYCSISSMMESMLIADWRKKKIKLPKLTYKDYCFLSGAAYGARTDVFDNEMKKINEPIMSLDQCSMYSHAMYVGNYMYPCGEITQGLLTLNMINEMNTFYAQNHRSKFFGVYLVDIDQIGLVGSDKPVMICRKMPDGKNDFSARNHYVIEQKRIYLMSIDIDNLKREGGNVTYIEGSHFMMFSDWVAGFDLFGSLAPIMSRKNEIDDILNDNPHLKGERTLCKNIPNTISGKLIQHPFVSQVIQVHTHDFYSHLTKIKGMVEDSVEILGQLNENTLVIKYRKEDDAITNIKNCYITMAIYAYTRYEMYKLIKSVPLNSRLMVSTDSFKFLARDYSLAKPYLDTYIDCNDKIKKFEPLLNNRKLFDETQKKVCGCFVSDVDIDNNCFFINGKNSWALFKIDGNNIKLVKVSLRGIRKSAVIVNSEDSIGNFTYNFVENNDQALAIVNTNEALDYVVNNWNNTIKDPQVVYKLFNNLVVNRQRVTTFASFKESNVTDSTVKEYLRAICIYPGDNSNNII